MATATRKKRDDNERDSIPVGYETVIDMYPLDFEEFTWANGIKRSVVDSLLIQHDYSVASLIFRHLGKMSRDDAIYTIASP